MCARLSGVLKNLGNGFVDGIHPLLQWRRCLCHCGRFWHLGVRVMMCVGGGGVCGVGGMVTILELAVNIWLSWCLMVVCVGCCGEVFSLLGELFRGGVGEEHRRGGMPWIQ